MGCVDSLLSIVSILVLFYRYRKKIEEELFEFSQSKVGLTFGILLAAISIAFIAETNNSVVIGVSVGLTIIAIVLITILIIQRNLEQ